MAKIELIEGSDGESAGSEGSGLVATPGADSAQPATERKRSAHRDSQKALLRDRKARRLHSDVIQAARVAWGSESVKNAAPGDRHSRVEAVLCEIRSLISQICLKHDVSRLVQSCIKYGSDVQRGVIADGIKGHVLSLSINQYGYRVVVKMLRYGSRPIQTGIVAELRGHISRLCLHRVGFRVVDLAWRSACNGAQKNDLLFDFYGKEHSLFRDTSKPAPSMPQLLQSLDDKKRDSLLAEVRVFLDKAVMKGTLQLSLMHTLLRHYIEHVADRESLFDSLKDQTLQICGTLDGVVATCVILDHASPKLRKTIIRSWKGQVATMAKDSDGYLAVAKALTIIDDTVILQKCIVNELLADMQLPELMQSPAASKVLLQIVAPGQARYFTVAERDILKTVETNSKKSGEARRADNLKHFVPAMIEALHSNFALASAMLRDRTLSGLFENCLRCAMQLSDEVRDAAKRYVQILVSNLSQGAFTDLDQEEHLIAHPVAHRVFKSLCAHCPSLMHPTFTEFCLDHLQAILQSRAVWILVPLAESLPHVRTAIAKKLTSLDCSAVPGLKKLSELCNNS